MASRSTAKGALPVLRTADAGFDAAFERIVRRREEAGDQVDRAVRKIIQRVREGGDEELRACVRKFDGAKIEQLEVTGEEWEEACDSVDGDPWSINILCIKAAK